MPITRRSAHNALVPTDEKITINLGLIDLGQVDLLVAEGFYASRSDLIRTAIRRQLAKHESAVRQVVERKALALGVRHITAAELKAARSARKRLHISVLGLAVIAADVTPELAAATIETIEVLGSLQASAAVRAALADRTR